MFESMKEKGMPAVSAGHWGARTAGSAQISSIHGGNGDDGKEPGSGDDVPGVAAPWIPKGSSDRILLVEDNPVNQKVAVAMLENLGYCVDVVDNGVEAVITATMVPYRAILMDCQIPVLNGYEATMEIRGQYGASRCSPIIAVTASSTESDQQRCLDAGMNGLLSKPLTVESLTAGMARWAPDPSSPDLDPPGSERATGLIADGGPSDDVVRPALDADVVSRLERLGLEAGEDFMATLAAIFLDDADLRIMAIRQALAADDGPALIHAAHTLCGASANVGAAELARLCARLATDGAVTDLESCIALLASVEAELARVRLALGSPATTPIPTGSIATTRTRRR
jgi:two-component system sensor histidine kinase/response regulator